MSAKYMCGSMKRQRVSTYSLFVISKMRITAEAINTLSSSKDQFKYQPQTSKANESGCKKFYFTY